MSTKAGTRYSSPIYPVYEHQYNPNDPSVRKGLEANFGGRPLFPRLGHRKAHSLAGEYATGSERNVLQQLIEEGWYRPEGVEGLETIAGNLPGHPLGAFTELLRGLGITGTGPPGQGSEYGTPKTKGLTGPHGEPTPAGAHQQQEQTGPEKAGAAAGEGLGGLIHFLEGFFSLNRWERIGKVLLGGILLLVAIFLAVTASSSGARTAVRRGLQTRTPVGRALVARKARTSSRYRSEMGRIAAPARARGRREAREAHERRQERSLQARAARGHERTSHVPRETREQVERQHSEPRRVRGAAAQAKARRLAREGRA